MLNEINKINFGSEKLSTFFTFIQIVLFSLLTKIQPDATVCRYLFTAKSLYMFRVSPHPSSGVLKTVTATSGTVLLFVRLAQTSPDQATLEGSSCTSIMTCTEGCGYRF